MYSSYILMGILKNNNGEPYEKGPLAGMTGKTLSFCKIHEFETYKTDLAVLKALVKEYVPQEYEAFFRGEFYEGTHDYNFKKAQGYTKYNAVRKTSYDEFSKTVKKLFADTAALQDERYSSMMMRFEEESFLRRLKTSDNGSIPFQLHLEEMDAIIRNQGQFYPFLIEQCEKIKSLVSFRIPYYVGPLTQKNAALDHAGSPRFAWAQRKPGKEKCLSLSMELGRGYRQEQCCTRVHSMYD